MDTELHIQGMTCNHCAVAVTQELMKLPSVVDVNVDVAKGIARVSSELSLEEHMLTAAIDEAGYTLTEIQ